MTEIRKQHIINMNKKLLLFLLALVLIVVVVQYKETDSIVHEQDSIPELSNLPEEVKQKRAAAMILSDYVVLEDTQYRLDISEQKAQELGVPPHLYEVIKNEISSTNAAIQKILENGDSIELCDIQAVSKAYKNGEFKLFDSPNQYSRVVSNEYDDEMTENNHAHE